MANLLLFSWASSPLVSWDAYRQARGRRLAFSFHLSRRGIEGWGLHFLASRKPIPRRSVDELLARMPAAVETDLRQWLSAEETVREMVADVVGEEIPIEAILHPDPSIKITDDRPFNEYYVLRRHFGCLRMANVAPAVVTIVALGLSVMLVMFRPRRPGP